MVTIREVAEVAGVSVATVSRWFSGSPVRESDAVARAVAQLGYRPNASAQSLKTGRQRAIGVVVPDITNPYFSAVVKGLEREVRRSGLRMLLAHTNESAELEAEILADLEGRVDGYILAPAHEQDRAPLALGRAGTPVVLLDRMVSGGEAYDSVVVDNIGGARMAAQHLAELGHTRIGAIDGPLATTPGRERSEGFAAGLREAGLEPDSAYERAGDFYEESGRALVTELMSLPEPPTAIFTANNLMTVGALKALRDLGLSLPKDVSLIGFDDLTFGSLLEPGLTCVARPDIEQGALAMNMLIDRLAQGGPSAPRHEVLPTRLEIRGTTARVGPHQNPAAERQS